MRLRSHNLAALLADAQRRPNAPDRPPALVLQWHVTDRCDLACSHCYSDGAGSPDVDAPEATRVLDQFRDLVGGLVRGGAPVRGHVNVTGGEPLLWPHLFDLLASVRARGMTCGVLSNGTRIDPAAARRLAAAGAGYVQVSVEGTPATHDAIRGPGSHARAVAGVRALVGEGIPVTLSFTAHRGNATGFGAVARLGRRLGASRVWADRLVPLGSGSALAALVDPDETRAFFAAMRSARRGFPNPFARRTEVWLGRALQFLDGGGGVPYRCTAGRTLLALTPGGDVYPCRRMPVRVGNVRESTLERIWHNSPFLLALRDPERVATGCEHCLWRRACGGGLRCLSHAVRGDPFTADPGCPLARGAPEVETRRIEHEQHRPVHDAPAGF